MIVGTIELAVVAIALPRRWMIDAGQNPALVESTFGNQAIQCLCGPDTERHQPCALEQNDLSFEIRFAGLDQ
jgi:hypothetical protein